MLHNKGHWHNLGFVACQTSFIIYLRAGGKYNGFEVRSAQARRRLGVMLILLDKFIKFESSFIKFFQDFFCTFGGNV